MSVARVPSPPGRALAIVLAIMLLPGCSTWRPIQEPIADVMGGKKPPNTILLHLHDGSVAEVAEPAVTGDTLRGSLIAIKQSERGNWQSRKALWQPRGEPFAIALSDVRGIDRKIFDGGKTSLVVVGIAGTVALIAAGASSQKSSGSLDWGDPILSSCPLIDSWTGTHWQFDSGTFGGAIFRPLTRTDTDVLAALEPTQGRLRLRVRNPRFESDFIDALAMSAIDHPTGTGIAPDSDGRLHTLTPGEWIAPIAAFDNRGRDARAMLATEDEFCWESAISGRDPERDADVVDGLELIFPRPPDTVRARLVGLGSTGV